jgi:hypothetical protein
VPAADTAARPITQRWLADDEGGAPSLHSLLGKASTNASSPVASNHQFLPALCAQKQYWPAPSTASMDDKDNANPTILNPSDLPSRRSDAAANRRDDGGTGLFDDLIPRYNYLSDPFEDPVSASDSDDDAVERIDEQEIYGVPVYLPNPQRP